MCIVLFRKDCIGIYNSVIETLLSYFTEIKIASAPYYVIESVSDISKIPHVKLFILVCDSAINYGSGSRDIRLATIKVLKTWGGELQCHVLWTFPQCHSHYFTHQKRLFFKKQILHYRTLIFAVPLL